MTAAAVIGFVIDAIRTIESGSSSPGAADLDLVAPRDECRGARHRAAADGGVEQVLEARHREKDPLDNRNSSRQRHCP